MHGRGHGDKLPPILARATRTYLRRVPHAAAARELDVTRMTYWRWRRRPEFRLALLDEWYRRRSAAA